MVNVRFRIQTVTASFQGVSQLVAAVALNSGQVDHEQSGAAAPLVCTIRSIDD
jgi:hypothetical protein